MPVATAITASKFWRYTWLYPFNPRMQAVSLHRAGTCAHGDRYTSQQAQGVALAMRVEIDIYIELHNTAIED